MIYKKIEKDLKNGILIQRYNEYLDVSTIKCIAKGNNCNVRITQDTNMEEIPSNFGTGSRIENTNYCIIKFEPRDNQKIFAMLANFTMFKRNNEFLLKVNHEAFDSLGNRVYVNPADKCKEIRKINFKE